MKITWILLAAFALSSAAVIPEQEYLPPTEELGDLVEAPIEESAALADDGYQYKTIRKLKYRNRRDVNELSAQYLPPVEAAVKEYLPPTEEIAEVTESALTTEAPEESAVLADDGYRYKTVRKLKYRKRRDVSELVAPEYLPPAEEEIVEAAEPTEVPEESAVLADDGYRYKTVRKLKYRKRRDVSELVAPEYLPPAEEEIVEAAEPTEVPEESAVLADDGYRYKTVRKLKYRKRRDVSELVAPEYLPPAEEELVEAAEPTEVPEESAVLADDGYRYKTVRKLKYRKRRDVSELVAPEYLPPAEEEIVEVAEPTEVPEESAVLADDGYRYKTVRKLKYRKRRDVSELVAPEYLPPAEEELVEAAEPTEVPEESAVLADDGYRYKTIRKLKYRKRRDVSELVAPECLPPTEEEIVEVAEPTEVPEESAVLADDGYRYKTVRKLKYRKRRDVSELVAPEYLPPAEEEIVEAAEPTEAPEESAVLADDGYRYKTVRKLKYRKRRDVSELVAPEYLPPAEEELVEAAEPTEVPEESAVLADDGYRYKTIRKLKYRKRRDVSELVAPEYLPPAEEEIVEAAEPTEVPEESAVLADDGYRYKTVRKLKYRKRRDVSELVAPEYLPPAEEELVEAAEPTEVPEESAVLADDGYRYKTIRKLKYRKRRDVSELVAPEYLPPAEEELVEAAEPTEVPEESAVLADDGYRYKTVRKLKYRKRRDVSELVAPEYLPPVEEEIVEVAEATEAPEESAVLADDGYRYKTVRKLKYRKRRDVSELVAPEYLPPAEEEIVEAAEPTEVPEESAVLADDGYRYKTVRKLKYRKRRDVSELVAPEYLPPVEEEIVEAAEPTEVPEESAVLADDGYRYKTVRKLKYRKRRDVSELVAPEYLPPVEEEIVEVAEATEAPEESAVLADDGYRYKTVRKLKYRKRRDVSELVAPEYLPPAEEEIVEAAEPTEVPEESAVLADDGYRYKTVRKLKYRKRRDVSELVAPEYLPPVEEEIVEAAEPTEVPEESAVLADDGYRYKTVRKLKYRKRRDVSELVAPEYLPPVEEEIVEVAEATEAPEESAVLADDGYRYKTVRKLKYRKRRDVSELVAPEYLPPAEEEIVEAAEPTEVPEESAVLADDGYRYKTVRKLKYRKRRDVSELVAPEYLPPLEEEIVEVAEATEAPEESAVLADDGYRYKTVRKLKYRKRRDVSELVAPEYLPPAEEEIVEAAEPTEVPEESAVLADDGYRYKTVRKLKYRKRRDVSELVAPEYLPPVEEEIVEVAEATEAPEESAVLADDGYRYKTVRKLKYRKRRDVSELVAPEYLPPAEEEIVEAAEPTEVPEESAVLADDGYRYKTVRKLKYRKRRDISEVIAPEYLPPTEEIAEVNEATEAPEESAALAEDGYRYKTVKRFKYRN